MARDVFIRLCARPDGREDEQVLEYHVTTSGILGCYSNLPMTLLLGIKGIGKSTAFKVLTAEKREGCLISGYAPGAKRFDIRASLRPGLFRQRFYSLFLAAIISLIEKSDVGQSAEKRALTQLLGPLLDSVIKPAGEAISTARSRVKGASAYGFGLTLDLSEDIEKKLDQFDCVAARTKVISYAGRGISVRIFIDDPDQALPVGEQGLNSLIGMILAANQININCNGVAGVTILLKTHVYRSVSGNEELANIFPTQIGSLSWTREELIEAVDQRLKFANCSYDNVFALSKKDMGEKIVPLLRNGPRDLFAWIALAGNAAKGQKITHGHFQQTTRDAGQFSLKQITTAYDNSVSSIPRLLKLVFSGRDLVGWDELVAIISDLRTNNPEFIELNAKNTLDLSSEYAKFFLEAGTLEVMSGGLATEPFGREYSGYG